MRMRLLKSTVCTYHSLHLYQHISSTQEEKGGENTSQRIKCRRHHHVRRCDPVHLSFHIICLFLALDKHNSTRERTEKGSEKC